MKFDDLKTAEQDTSRQSKNQILFLIKAISNNLKISFFINFKKIGKNYLEVIC